MSGTSTAWVDQGLAAARALVAERMRGPSRQPVDRWVDTVIHGSGGGAQGSIVVRIGSDSEARDPWSVVAKIVRRNNAAPSHRDHWRREPAVYDSSWIRERLPPSISLPDCLGTVETDLSAVMVLAHVSFDDRASRGMGWYRDAARALGTLNGTRLGADPPEWLTRDFLAVEADRMTELAPVTVAEPPDALAGVHRSWSSLLPEISSHSRAMVEWLDEAPDTLSHLDASSRNLARRDDGFVLIDWALAGLAPVGTDLAGMFTITMMHADVAADALDPLESALLDGYLVGLREMGAEVDDEAVALAFSMTATLRFGRFLTELHDVMHTDPDLPAAIVGRPIDEVIAAWEALAAHLVPHAERALDAVR
jgi:hypothetical protein